MDARDLLEALRRMAPTDSDDDDCTDDDGECECESATYTSSISSDDDDDTQTERTHGVRYEDKCVNLFSFVYFAQVSSDGLPTLA
jgi:hypothetical protein